MTTEKTEKVVRLETKISYVIITVLLCIISAIVGRDSVIAQVASLEKGRALNEQAIKSLCVDNEVKMKLLLSLQKDVTDIKLILAEHVGGSKK